MSVGPVPALARPSAAEGRTARRVLLTGASGFIGQALAEALVAAGHGLRAQYRREKPPRRLLALRDSSPPGAVELVRSGLSDDGALAELARGADAVVHGAALASDWGSPADFEAVNVVATGRLLAAAREAGIGRFLYLSSASVQGFGSHRGSSEEGPLYPPRFPYPASKLRGEELVLAANGKGIGTLAVRPANVYGPGDFTSTYRMFAMVERGRMGYIGRGEALTCPVYVEDLARGVVDALACDALLGGVLNLSDGTGVSWADYLGRMYELAGGGRKPFGVPAPLAFAAARAGELAWGLLGLRGSPPLTTYVVLQGSTDYWFSREKARRLIGFEPRVFYREGLELTRDAWLADRASGEWSG